MSKFWSETARNIQAYVPGEQPKDKKYIKLNANENPYPPSPKALEAINQAANGGLRLYPDPDCEGLRRTIAARYGLNMEEVFVGNGSDELLAFSFPAFFNPGKPILFPDITFSFYDVCAALFHIDYTLVPLNEDFTIPVEKFLVPNGGIIFPNPNAPTGIYMPLDSVEKILKQNPDTVVIVDEAYIDFGGESAVKFIHEYPNLLVIQTVSKSRSLAGLRIGYAMGNSELIEALRRVKNSFNSYTLDTAALSGAQAAFEDDVYFNETINKVVCTRERVISELKELGFHTTAAKTNFVFITHPQRQARSIFEDLRERAILVRYFNKPRIDNFLRITIGSNEEMDSLLAELKNILG